MRLAALGPLSLSHDDLWITTWGELLDLLYGYRYRKYLENKQQAQLACWLLNGSGNLKHPVRIEDLVGFWVDGEIMDKAEFLEHQKGRIRKNKARKAGEN